MIDADDDRARRRILRFDAAHPRSSHRGTTAVQKLIRGIHEFQEDSFRPLQGLFESLAHGQNPETLFITCSDSRIDPNLLTKSQPGDLFILRNAGNIIPPHSGQAGGEAATIEFAVAGLGVKDIIICGHSHCGAVKGLLDPTQCENLPALAQWLTHAEATKRIIEDNYSDLSGADRITAAIEENVLVQLENLRTLPSVKSRLVKGDLRLHGWVYEIETGEVFAYDRLDGQFVPLEQYRFPPSEAAMRRRLGVAI
jgi:carbonic anhydrase